MYYMHICMSLNLAYALTVSVSVFFSSPTMLQLVKAAPHYVSGGNEQNPCGYFFIWETVGACAIRPITNTTCQLTTATNFTFDLLPLSTPSDNSGYYQIRASDSSNFYFNISMCVPLEKCGEEHKVSVCQLDSANKYHVCGLTNSQKLSYFDGALSLHFGEGEVCKHNNRPREVLVALECDRKANISDTRPVYLNESECVYSFAWATPLACLPQELDCVAAGGKYDLTPLLQRRHWEVDTRTAEDAYSYVIGGCRCVCTSLCVLISGHVCVHACLAYI